MASRYVAARLLIAATNSLLLTDRGLRMTDQEEMLRQSDPVFRSREFDQRELPGASRASHAKHLFIPVHPPKFGYVGTAFTKQFDNEARYGSILLTFMVTSRVEREMFENYLEISDIKFPVAYEVISAIEVCEWLGLSGAIPAFIENKNNGIVNFKKVLGLYRALCVGALEVACIDIDVVFTQHPSAMFDRLRENFSKKLVIAGFAGMGRNIMMECSRFFSQEDEKKLLELTNGGSLYNWFFDVPFYPRRETLAFFAHVIDLHVGIENVINRLMWGTFEHTLFQYYLMLYEGFRIVDIQPYTGPRVTDDLWLHEIIQVAQVFDYVPVWAPLGDMISFVTADDVKMVQDNFLLAMHVDRVPARPQG